MDSDLFEGSTRSYGIHPRLAADVTEADWERLEALLDNDPEANVGECGLDRRYTGYTNDEEYALLQDEVFKRQASLARDLHRDLHIHCVGDYGRIIGMLVECGYPKENPSGKVIFHRFGGDISAVKSAQVLNPVFSLHADSFRKKSTLEAISQIPAGQVQFETDADEKFHVPANKNEEETVSLTIDALTAQLDETEKAFKKL